MINALNKKNVGTQKIIRSKFSNVGTFGNVRPLVKENGLRRVERFSAEAPIAEKLLTNDILASQPDYGLARLKPHLESVSLSTGEQLFSSGECVSYVYFPETAVISHLYTLADGNAIEVAMVGNEGASGLCGLFDSQPAAHWGQVTVGGNAWRIKTNILKQEFARGETIQTSLLNYVNAHITQISQRSVCKSFHIIEKRLSTWLLMLHDRADKNQLPLTQEQMSLCLGVHRPSVTLVAQALREKGLIDYMRGKVYILDRKGLEFSACECYSAQKIN